MKTNGDQGTSFALVRAAEKAAAGAVPKVVKAEIPAKVDLAVMIVPMRGRRMLELPLMLLRLAKPPGRRQSAEHERSRDAVSLDDCKCHSRALT
jgi:hypothetical protein